MGVHYRMDSHEGLILGEAIAVRRLHQVQSQALQVEEAFGEHSKIVPYGTYM